MVHVMEDELLGTCSGLVLTCMVVSKNMSIIMWVSCMLDVVVYLDRYGMKEYVEDVSS